MNIDEVRKELRALANDEKAKVLRRFFKTGPGEYGDGDRFIGVTVPQVRKVASKYQALALDQAEQLLHSAIHEERLLALLIAIAKYQKGDGAMQEAVYRLYLRNTAHVNNWDLVDASAEHIVGAHLFDRGRETLAQFARSNSLWERRISILATFHFIKRGDFADTLKIARLLLADREDLIHKAVGWMLREVGKRDFGAEQGFLREHYRVMPRTMLRYAIERFPEDVRRMYLRGEIG